jgi:hypothetical protein
MAPKIIHAPRIFLLTVRANGPMFPLSARAIKPG